MEPELQAALVLPQLAKLDERNELRWQHVKLLCEALADVPGVRPFVDPNEEPLPAFFKLGFQFDETAFGLPRAKLVASLRAEGYAVDEGFAAAHVARSPKRFRQGSPLNEAELEECAQLDDALARAHRLLKATVRSIMLSRLKRSSRARPRR